MSATVGVVFPARADVATLPAFARRAEALGYDELWVVEDCFESGGLSMTATALAVTERLAVGIGLMPVPMRNPALAAMELATLARLHPGRVTAAFGHGVRAWMEQIGAAPPRRLAALAEVVSAVRALLGGETVSVAGRYVRLSAVTLASPPPVAPPVLIGSTGPRAIALAAELADGLLLPEGCGLTVIRQSVSRLRAGQALAAYAWLSVDDDDEVARRALAPAVEHWWQSGLYPGPVAAAGLADGPPPATPTPALAAELAVAGDPDACAASAARLIDAGARRLILMAAGPDADGQYGRFAADVLPRLARAAGG